jgi:UPF0755 protein
MVKKGQIISIVVLIIFFVTLVFFVFFKNKEGKEIEVFIPKGSSPVRIAKILKDSNIISYPKFFVVTVKIFGYSKHLQAGLYDFNEGDSLISIIKKLKNGDNKNVKVTIPEGFTIKQIGEVLEEKNICKKDKFITIATAEKLEGYLFPNTYFLSPQSDENDVIKTMNNEFNKYWSSQKESRLKQINMSKKDVIILASIVEKEAVSEEERPVIAGVFLNRLRKGMRLESCATVLYAMGKNKERLTYADLEFQSPYNTYRHFGLTPGPICNPGAKAIDAVLYPAITNSLYFVSKGNGTHFFSNTLEEHVKNKKLSKKGAK